MVVGVDGGGLAPAVPVVGLHDALVPPHAGARVLHHPYHVLQGNAFSLSRFRALVVLVALVFSLNVLNQFYYNSSAAVAPSLAFNK